MNRFILGIGAFILTFGISTSLVGLFFGFPKLDPSHSHSAKSSKIMRVLDRDIDYGERRRNDVLRLALKNKAEGLTYADTEMSEEFAVITTRYVDDMSAIDTSGTPADFAYAWNEHVAAWNEHEKHLRSMHNPDSGPNHHRVETDRISETYFQVLRIAKRYGVPMKARYYR